jgi:predicted PolB exonuclease-like 3'-5' exonuclease
MGYDNENARRVVLDLETVAIDGAADLAEPVKAPSNYKDAKVIADFIEKAQREQTEKAALYPWTARIVALGTWPDGTQEPRVTVCLNEADEAQTLRAFWQRHWHATFVTFNGLGFDLPVLMARSRLLGVDHPMLNIDRYRSPHTDLMQLLTFRGQLQARSLTWFARRFGLPVHDDIGGKDVAAMAAAGDYAAIERHCLSDVTLTRALAERLGVLRPLAEQVA